MFWHEQRHAMEDRIKFKQLGAFRAIMTTGSLTAAARQMHLTQPAISKQIQALETEIGLRLFDRRQGSPMTPTKDGIAFFKSIETTLAGIEQIPNIARAIAKADRSRLRLVATSPMLNSAPLMNAVVSFRRRHPDTFLSLEAKHRLDIEPSIADGEADIGLALLPTQISKLTAHPILETSAVAVVATHHPLAGKDAIDALDLLGQTIILPSRQPLRDLIDNQLLKTDEVLADVLESSSTVTCCRMAAAGLGIAICDPLSPTIFSKNDLKSIRWKPELTLTYGALVNDRNSESKSAIEFLELIRNEFDQLDARF